MTPEQKKKLFPNHIHKDQHFESLRLLREEHQRNLNTCHALAYQAGFQAGKRHALDSASKIFKRACPESAGVQ